MKRFLGILAVIVGLSVSAAAAQAQYGFGAGHYGHHGSHGVRHTAPHHGYYGSGFGLRTSYYGGLPGVYYGGNRHHHHWHDTSHYDFHPGGFRRHYDHFDYVPSHYDWHDEGHWDHH